MSYDAEFDAIIGRAKRAVGLSRGIAADVYPNGAEMSCAKCGASSHASVEQCARYFSTGWPLHCGATMSATPVSRSSTRREP